jgi:ATP-dependent helicase/nuclease subunit A
LLDRAAAFGATSTPSIELFLRSVEQRGGEVKRELSGTSDTVRVMTVHGAKGLEAPVVILPDTTREVRKDTAGVLLAESGAPFWVGGSKGDSEATAKVRTLSQARELREHRRLLYVALTRARDRLVICGAAHGRSGEGFDQNSWYALCQRAMNRLREKALVTDPDEAGVVRLGAPAPALDGAGAAPGATSGLPAWLGAPTPQETSTARILAPSNLSGNEPPVLPPFGAERRIRLRRGRIIHRLLQVLPAVAPERRMEAADRLLGAHADVSAAERADMREAALGLLAHPDFQPLFGPGGRSEAPVIGRLGSDIINGRVDRLAITDTEVLVIDYKTDRPAPADVSGVGQAYLRQMAAYRAILAEAWPGRRVRCLLAWTDGPILMELPEAILEAALEGLR